MSRIFAIPDIHGRKDLLDLLLEALKEDLCLDITEDKLIFLGDMIDRGPDSKGVMDTIRMLVDSNPGQVIALAGNHEWLMIDACTKDSYDERWLWGVNGGEATQASFPAGKVPDEYVRWAASLPLYHEEPGFFFSHAPIAKWAEKALPGVPGPPFKKQDLIWTYHEGSEAGWARDHGDGVVGVCGHIHRLRENIADPRFYEHYIFADAGAGCAPWAPLVAVEVKSRTVIKMNPPEVVNL